MRQILKITMNQCFCDFGRKIFTKQHMLNMVEQDQHLLQQSLNEWQQKGFIRFLKPLAEARLDDDCVEMLRTIEVDF